MSISRSLAIFGSATLLGACATLPRLPPESKVSVTDVVNNIRCELQSAAIEAGFDSSTPKWIAGIALELKVIANSNGVADAAVTLPLNPGSSKIGFKVGQTAESTRTAGFKFQQPLAEKKEDYCLYQELTPREALLEGRLGFREWLSRLAYTMKHSGVKPTQVSYALQFVIKPSAEFSPRFSLIPIGDNTFEGGVALSAQESRFHSLNIVVEPVKGEQVISVRIVKDERQKVPSAVSPQRLNDLLDQQSIKTKLDELLQENQ
jgi:hypothetical protein